MPVLTFLFFLFMMFSSRQNLINHAIFSDLPLKMIQLVDFTAAGGGASNQNYFLKTKQDKMFLRVGTDEDAIAREASVAIVVSDAGFAPELIGYSKEDKIIATRMIENLTDFSLHDPHKIATVAQLVRNVHDSDIRFNVATSPKEVMMGLLDEAKTVSVTYPEGFLTNLNSLTDRIGSFDPAQAKPCHLDLHTGNFLYDGTRFWIIDWEYASNSDPLFDLAVLSATENYSDQEMLVLLTAYGKPEHYSKLYNLRILADARWYVWCLVRGQTSTLDFPYEKEADRYLQSFQKRISGITFI